jgi:hypothetical protein
VIEICEGRLGGGKTLWAVERMAKYLATGGNVCTNVLLFPEELWKNVRRKWGVEYERTQLKLLPPCDASDFFKTIPLGTRDHPALCVIDEVAEFFGARNWKKQEELFLSFLRQSRKLHVDVIFISQHADQVDKGIRQLAQYIWVMRDLTTWKMPLLGISFPFPVIVRMCFDYTGRHQVAPKEFWHRDESWFKCYDTDSLVRDFGALDERKKAGGFVAVKDCSPVRRWVTKRGALVGFILGLFLSFAMTKGQAAYRICFGQRGKPKAAAVVKSPAARPVIRAAPVVRQRVLQAVWETQGGLMGMIDGEKVVLVERGVVTATGKEFGVRR